MELDRMKLKAIKLAKPEPLPIKKDAPKSKKKLTEKQQRQREQDEILYQRLRDFYDFD